MLIWNPRKSENITLRKKWETSVVLLNELVIVSWYVKKWASPEPWLLILHEKSDECFLLFFFFECFQGVVFVKSCTCDFCLEGNSQIKQWSQKQSCKTILNFFLHRFIFNSSFTNIASSTRFVLQFTLLLHSVIVF